MEPPSTPRKSSSRFIPIGNGLPAMSKKQRILLEQSKYLPAEQVEMGTRVKYRHFIWATLFIFTAAIVFWYYVAFPLANLKFTNGFPRFGTPPSPNFFRTDRYTWSWVFIYILSAVQFALPILLAAALVNNTIPEYSEVHYLVARYTAGISFVIFIGLSVIWLFFCNGVYPDYSFCHDVRWCCVFFGSSDHTWCPNTTPCDPHVSAGQLIRSDEFFQIWLFALLFSFGSLVHRTVNQSLRRKGMWKEVFVLSSAPMTDDQSSYGDDDDDEQRFTDEESE